MIKKYNHGKNINEFTAYVNATFNGGSYVLPPVGQL